MRRSGLPRRLLLAAATMAAVAVAYAAPPETLPATAAPPVMPLDVAVRYALEHNPQLAAARTQRGLAAGGVVLAHTYPYNPVYSGVVLSANGKDITNRVFNEHVVTLELEVRGQRQHHRAAAAA